MCTFFAQCSVQGDREEVSTRRRRGGWILGCERCRETVDQGNRLLADREDLGDEIDHVLVMLDG